MNTTTLDLLTLDANPSDAPCCVKLTDSQGRSALFQTDYDWPAVAGLFGWSTHDVQCCQNCQRRLRVSGDCSRFACHDCNDLIGQCCDHANTDGTVDCKACGIRAADFITEARLFLDDHDGETCENPGYTLE